MLMKLYNARTRSVEEFLPQSKKSITMYVCGITPNNAAHLGHAFTYVSFDVLIRFLRYLDYNVKYVQNVTDINDSDDVIKQANETHKTWQEVATYWTNDYLQYMDELNVQRPNDFIKATHVMPKILEIIGKLVETNYAYEKNGFVYFDTQKHKVYGILDHFSDRELLLLSKERGNNTQDLNKKHPLDFVLWFKSQHNEPSWPSRYGPGRPGWHIECSAIILQYLGNQIDIHGGGRDLLFPHHESEIAQSEAYTNNAPFVNVWMHTAMVMYKGDKMSKSLGNLILIKDVLQKYTGNQLRWYLLSKKYRNEFAYQEEDLEKAALEINTILSILSKFSTKKAVAINRHDFDQILLNDLNLPLALEYIKTICSRITDSNTTESLTNVALVKSCLETLGIVV